MKWDGNLLVNFVKEGLYVLFGFEGFGLDEDDRVRLYAHQMGNKEYAALLKKKYSDLGMSLKDSDIRTTSDGITIFLKPPFPKEIDGDNDHTIEISWSMAARHIRAWEFEENREKPQSKIQQQWDETHLCGDYHGEHCEYLVQAKGDTVMNGKKLDSWCPYCTSENKVRKIGNAGLWTGISPKFCPKRKALNSKENKTMTPSFDFKSFISENDQLKKIPLDMLIPYHNHKFKLYEGERLEDMVQSVKTNGVLTPIIVRAIDGEKYEILAGHNRANAARLAGLTVIPAEIKENLSDEDAEMYVIETNVMQRGFDDLSVTERAEIVAARYSEMFSEEKCKAIEKEVAALNGEKVEYTESGNSDVKKSKFATVCETYGLSKDSIARLLRISKLVPELKPCVDNGSVAVRTAVNLSYLLVAEQRKVSEMVTEGGYSVDMRKSALLKELSAQKQLNDKLIEAIIYGQYNPDAKPPKPKAFKIKAEIAEKYFALDWDNDKIQEVIAAALEMYYNNKTAGRMTEDNDEQEDG